MKSLRTIIFTLLAASLFAVQANGQEKIKVYTEVDQMPEYPGGEEALKNFIAENISYPEQAKKNGVTGKVYISFIVNKAGEVQDARVVRGVHPELDKESLRVVNKLKKFKPGIKDGEPVNVAYTLPINFAHDGDGDKK